jgi:hypothetical protein
VPAAYGLARPSAPRVKPAGAAKAALARLR